MYNTQKALKKNSTRMSAAAKAAGFHFLASLSVALLCLIVVFLIWYPTPYDSLSNGRDLFRLVILVDIICGPLLTLVIFNPKKRPREKLIDLLFVGALQISALSYGLFITYSARPLFLVFEVDRFKVVSSVDIGQEFDLKKIDKILKPVWWAGPNKVAIRYPLDATVRNSVLFESLDGGRDYSDRPQFYIPYEGLEALAAFNVAKPLHQFLVIYPNEKDNALKIAQKYKLFMAELRYLPITGRADWVAIIDSQGTILGFLKGSGF
jgi:hypothetical protein